MPAAFCGLKDNGGIKYPLVLATVVLLFYGLAAIGLSVVVNTSDNIVKNNVTTIMVMLILGGSVDVALGVVTLMRLSKKNVKFLYIDIGVFTVTLILETVALVFVLRARKEPYIQGTVFAGFIMFARWTMQISLWSRYYKIIKNDDSAITSTY